MRYIPQLFLFGCVLFFPSSTINAQTRHILPDSTFGNHGHLINKFGNGESAYSMDVQADGKIIIGAAVGRPTVIRFLSNGLPDTTFGKKGYAYLPYNGNTGNGAGGIKVLPNGKIIATGSNDSCGFITRLNANGRVDSAFGHKGFAVFLRRQYCRCPAPLVVLQDGSIIAEYARLASPYITVLVKADSNGVFDNTFGTAGEVVINEIMYKPKIVLDHNNRIIVTGSSASAMYACRFLPNGTRDNSFGVNGMVSPAAHDSSTPSAGSFALNPVPVVLADNSIILAADNGANHTVVGAVHLFSDGTQDKQYGKKGVAVTAFSYASAVSGVALGNNEIVLMGIYAYTAGPQVFTGELTVLSPSGKIDSVLQGGSPFEEFQYDTSKGNQFTNPVAMQVISGGKILMAGFTLNQIWLARYVFDGFGSGVEVNDPLATQLTIYPNPADNLVTVTCQSIKETEVFMKVLNITGKTVLEKPLPKGQKTIKFSTSQMCNGIYFIQLQSGNQISTTKFVIAR